MRTHDLRPPHGKGRFRCPHPPGKATENGSERCFGRAEHTRGMGKDCVWDVSRSCAREMTSCRCCRSQGHAGGMITPPYVRLILKDLAPPQDEGGRQGLMRNDMLQNAVDGTASPKASHLSARRRSRSPDCAAISLPQSF